MSYIVLARKYRPQIFDEVYAQEHITTILKNAISINRLAHAFLFTGSRGVGKTSMARILAKSLNCMAAMSANPCGVCDNCVEISSGISTDVVEIDGASNTGVEDIRDLQKELMYSTSKSRYKIFIIDEVHMLSKNAFNALLKTLEEPPSQVIFVFATTEPHKVLPTIISRCQRYDFKRIPIEAIVKNLAHICKQENIDIEKEALYIVAKKAEGSMRDALSLTDQLIATSKDKITANDVLSLFGIVSADVYHKITEYIHKKETAAIIGMIHTLLDTGNDLQELLGGYLDYLRNLLLFKTKVPLPDLPLSHKNELEKIEKLFNEDTLLYLMAILIKTKNDIKYFSNPILLAEMTFIKLTKMEDMTSLNDLLKNWQYSDLPATRVPAQPIRKANAYSQRRIAEEPEEDENRSSVVREQERVLPQFEKMTADIFNNEKEHFLAALAKTQPVSSQMLSRAELEKVNDKELIFTTDSFALDYLTKEKQPLTKFISTFFKMNLSLKFTLQEKPKGSTASQGRNELKGLRKKITIEDIEKESPNLAGFIEKSDASFTQIKTNQNNNRGDDSEEDK